MRPALHSIAVVALLTIALVSKVDANDALSQETISWNVSLWGKPRAFTEHIEELARLVRKMSNHNFTLNLSYDGLAKSYENFEGVSNNDFQMAQTCVGYDPVAMRSVSVTEIPLFEDSDFVMEARILQSLFEDERVIKEMNKRNVMLLMPTPVPQYNVFGVGKEPDSLDYFRGAQVRALGGFSQAFNEFGANSVYLPLSNLNVELYKRTVKAATLAPHTQLEYNTLKHTTWLSENLNLGTINCPVIVNSFAYNALPSRYKTLLSDSVNSALDHYICNYIENVIDPWKQLRDEYNIKTIDFKQSSDRLSKLRDAAKRDWVLRSSAVGLDEPEYFYDKVSTIRDNLNGKADPECDRD